MTTTKHPLYIELQSAIEHKLSVNSNFAAYRYMNGVEFEEVQAWFEAIAAEKGLQDAKIVVTDETFSRGTLDVLMSWAEVEQ